MFEEAFILSNFLEYIENRGASKSYVELNKKIIKCFMKSYNIQKQQDYINFLTEKTVKKRQSYVYDIMLRFVEYNKDILDDYNNIRTSIKNFKKVSKDSLRQSIYLDNNISDNIIKRLSTKKHALISWIQRDTGARAGDVLRLTKDRVKYEPVTLSDKRVVLAMSLSLIKKGGRVSKSFIYNNQLAEHIEKRISYLPPHEDYVFLDRDIVHKRNRNDITKLMNRNYYLYWQDLKKVCDELGIDKNKFATHDWRRNFAKRVWEDVLHKTDIISLKEAMGHSKIETTTIYLKSFGNENSDILYSLQSTFDK